MAGFSDSSITASTHVRLAAFVDLPFHETVDLFDAVAEWRVW